MIKHNTKIVNKNHPQGKDLMLFLPMNEGGGLTCIDYAGAFNGTLVNSPVWGSTGIGSVPKITLNSSKHVKTNFNSNILYTTKSWSIIFKIIINSNAGSAILVSSTVTAGNPTLLMHWSPTASRWVWYCNGAGDKITFAPISLGVPHTICITYDGSFFRTYVDGVYNDISSSTFTSLSAFNSIWIGWEDVVIYNGSKSLDGSIADFRIYSRILTPSDQIDISNNPNNVFFNKSIITTFKPPYHFLRVNSVLWTNINTLNSISRSIISKIDNINT